MSQWSDFITHFTKPTDTLSALDVFQQILDDTYIKGGTGYIKGGFPCICFTETPLDVISLKGYLDVFNRPRYSEFGFLFSKKYIYSQGGRPVIYQSNEEYDLLIEEQKYRHVLYDPVRPNPVDLTWEREWRLKADHLPLDTSQVHLIVPNKDVLESVKDNYSQRYAQPIDIDPRYPKLYRQMMAGDIELAPFPYEIFSLR